MHYKRVPEIFTYPFEKMTQVTIPGTVHQLGTQWLMITVVDTQSPPEPIWWALEENKPPVASETYDVTLYFPTPQTGTVILRVMNL